MLGINSIKTTGSKKIANLIYKSDLRKANKTFSTNQMNGGVQKWIGKWYILLSETSVLVFFIY